MLTEKELEKNRELLENFVQDRPLIYQLKSGEIPFGYIYCIENTINHLKYIGSVYTTWTDVANPTALIQLKKRATQYLYEYNHNIKTKDDPDTRKYNRPIILAMMYYGFENFIMYPLAQTTIMNHNDLEVYFIEEYNTTRSGGYNIRRIGASVKKVPNYHNAEAKRLRSTSIICINLDNKEILCSDSMKLFGDYLGKGKDIVKNCNRNGRRLNGWFIFYTDKDKRDKILKDVLTDRIVNKSKHTTEAKKLYSTLCSLVNTYIFNPTKIDDLFPEFKILDSLIYSDE